MVRMPHDLRGGNRLLAHMMWELALATVHKPYSIRTHAILHAGSHKDIGPKTTASPRKHIIVSLWQTVRKDNRNNKETARSSQRTHPCSQMLDFTRVAVYKRYPNRMSTVGNVSHEHTYAANPT